VDPDLGGPKTCGSGSATQLFSILVVIFALLDPDPQFECGSGSSNRINAENVGRTQLPHQVAAKLPRVLSRATLRKKYSYLPNSKVN
jgi:hypothetical protein